MGLDVNMPSPTEDENEGHYCTHEWVQTENGGGYYTPSPHKITVFYGSRFGYGAVSGHLSRKEANRLKKAGGWAHWEWDDCGYGES